MATSASSPGVDRVESRRPLLRRSRHRVPQALWYALAAVGVVLLVIIVQLALHVRRSEPRDARAIVERELRMSTLRPDERVIRTVSVFRRNAADYFRATRGLLVLTDKRLIYLGAPPRDVTGTTDAPPSFDQRDFRIDTLVRVEPSFAMLGFARALRIETPDGGLTLGVPSREWPKAALMEHAWKARHDKLHALGVWQKRVQDARAHLQAVVAEFKRQPQYHVVRPGDAISALASWYETSPEKIRELNGLPGDRIKVGQRLLVREGAN